MLGEFEARKYDDGIGRFTGIDPWWEKFRSWSPYHYCLNNPLKLVDRDGLVPGPNLAELKLALNNPLDALQVLANKSVAENVVSQIFDPSELEGGRGDAFRHAYWSAMNARDIGPEMAKKFGDAHEDSPNNNEADKKMDLHNNAVGIEIGKAHPDASDEELADRIMTAMAAGKLQEKRNPHHSTAGNPSYPEDQNYDGVNDKTDEAIRNAKEQMRKERF